MDGVDQTIRMNNLSRDLKKYGFASSSQEAIAQAGAIYGCNAEELNAEIELVQITKAQMNEMLNRMQRLWVFKETTNQQMNAALEQISQVTERLNSMIKTINMVEMNQTVFEKKLHSLKDSIHDSFMEDSSKPRQKTRHVEESSTREKEVQQKLDKPIDRNGVAPADVSIENIFYSGSGRR